MVDHGVLLAMVNKKILITGGGTGGHLFPALAIGEEINIRDPKAQIHYVGSSFGLEAKVFPIKDVWHTLLPIRGLQRGLNFQGICRNTILPFRIIRSLLKVKYLFNDFQPEIIIGTGGYASALPLFMATKKFEMVPVILQEQNSFPGITTRLFANKAKRVCVAFDQLDKNIKKDNIVVTGNPVRKGIDNGDKNRGLDDFNFNINQKTIFLFGGSQGSAYLNKIMSQIIKNLSNAGIQVLWQTGDLDYTKYSGMESRNTRILPFINKMAEAYAISDLLICRSGALTLAEITVCGKPALLIPYPHAAGDHQTKNARSLAEAGAARILVEKTLNPKTFLHTVMNLIHNKKELNKMSKSSLKLGHPNATEKIVDHIYEALA